MMGPEESAERVRGWLAGRLPARLRILEQRLNLPAGQRLADPAKVAASEDGPISIESWPAVYVLPQQMTGMTLTEVLDDASEVYRCVYAVQVLAWCRAEDYVTTDLLRKRYVLAIREALLERKTLGGDPAIGDAAVDPNSFRESYSDVFVDKATAATIAAAFLTLAVITSETVGGPPARGTAQSFEVTPHPGLS